MQLPDIKKLFRFGVVGGAMTVLFVALNALMLKVFHTNVSVTYTIAYLVCISLSFYFNTIFTFKSALNLKNMLKYYLVYGSGMLLGLGLLHFYQKLFSVEEWIYSMLTLPFTILWNFTIANRTLKPVVDEMVEEIAE